MSRAVKTALGFCPARNPQSLPPEGAAVASQASDSIFGLSAAAAPSRRRPGLYLLLRGTVAFAAAHTARVMGISPASFSAGAITAAAFLAPLPALVALVGVHVHQGRR